MFEPRSVVCVRAPDACFSTMLGKASSSSRLKRPSHTAAEADADPASIGV